VGGEHVNHIISSMQKPIQKPFVVCETWAKEYVDTSMAGVAERAIFFDKFSSNPEFSDVSVGVALFEKECCDFIISVGGGTAIDVAKGVNILRGENSAELLDAPRAKHLTLPTTAGTGSESTCFSVLYKNEEKISIEHKGILPEYVILEPKFLHTLPSYYKKSALLDALCQAVESLWANGKTAESKAYATSAVRMIFEDVDDFLAGGQESALRILQAANLAGKAINITRTTAAHAMSYKLSTMFGLAHGHAVAVCMQPVWRHLLEVDSNLIENSRENYEKFVRLLKEMDLRHISGTVGDIDTLAVELADSVNIQRLGNHPVSLSKELLIEMYSEILTDLSKL